MHNHKFFRLFDLMGVKEHTSDEVLSYRKSVVVTMVLLGLITAELSVQPLALWAKVLIGWVVSWQMTVSLVRLHALYPHWYPINGYLMGPPLLGAALIHALFDQAGAYTMQVACVLLLGFVGTLEWLYADRHLFH